jgi:hypothetical protein
MPVDAILIGLRYLVGVTVYLLCFAAAVFQMGVVDPMFNYFISLAFISFHYFHTR